MSYAEEVVFLCDDLRKEIFSYLRSYPQKTCNTCKDVLVWDKRVKYYIETTWYLTAPKNCYCKECWVKSANNYGPPCIIS